MAGLLAFLGVTLLSSGLRLIEWGGWKGADAFVNGLPVLPTGDAFAWLAGAEGIGRLAGWAMSNMVGALSAVAGLEPEWIAFWLPLAVAWLPGGVIALVCWQRSRPIVGLAAGIFAASSLGYMARTRLGYADTDLFALFLASGFAALWAWFIERVLDLPEASGKSSRNRLAALAPPACYIVIWAGLAQWLYTSGYPVMLAVTLTGMAVGTVVAGVWVLPALLVTASGALLALHFGAVGVVCGAGIVFLLLRWTRLPLSLAALLLVAVFIAAIVGDQVFVERMMTRVAAYSGWGAPPAPVSGWVLPRIDTSIEETATIGWAEYVQRTGSHWLFLLAGLAGYVVTILRWPSLLTFLPLLGLGLASFELGHRFAMYAAPVLGLGLGLGLALVLERLRAGRAVKTVTALCLAAAIVVFIGWQARDLDARPAVDPQWASALKALRDVASNHGRVWTWWDEGYPAQFYARLPTLADGGNASRLRVFALGRVFGAREPAQAAAFLRNAAAERLTAIQASDDWREASYGAVPLAPLTHFEAASVQRMLQAPQGLEPDGGNSLPDEIVVASWRTLRKAQWADLYGQWRLTTGEAGYGQIATLQPPVRLDQANGMLETAEGPVPLRSIHILESGNRYRNQWAHADGAHALINNDAGDGVLMDDALFRTLAVQLLIAEPAVLDRHFELLVDAAPAARIFRVRSVPPTPEPGD